MSFNETMDVDKAREFENKRGDVAGCFRTSNLGRRFEVLGGEQRAIGEIMQTQHKRSDKTDKNGDVTAHSRLVAVAPDIRVTLSFLVTPPYMFHW